VIGSAADIEIDIFSGRPNPTFALRGQKASRLAQLLRMPRPAAPAEAGEPGLGFRGFIVRLVPDEGNYRVLGTTIRHRGQVFRDPDRAVEKFIVAALPRALRNLVAPLLGPPSAP
jgi:hypothetical protein